MLEGCNQVQKLYGFRFLQSVISKILWKSYSFKYININHFEFEELGNSQVEIPSRQTQHLFLVF